jgi:integrase/recombinase XerC
VVGKGKTDEEPLTVAPELQEVLRAWVAARGDDPGPLFYHFTGEKMHAGRLSDRSVGRITNWYGLGHAHGLRHSAVTGALDKNSGDVRKVAKFSRHKNIQTLLKYDDNRRDLGGEVSGDLAKGLR